MWRNIYYSFPIQLFIFHLRKNILLLALWMVLILIVAGGLGSVLGIPYLFLDPEYLNRVSWMGFFLMGIGFAVFTMSFHMTTYMKDGAQFKFLAVIPKPFFHFCLNNSIVPLIFYLIYIYNFIQFQLNNELESNWLILEFLAGFFTSTLLTFFILFYYFKWTNKDFFLLFSDSLDKRLRKIKIPRANIFNRYKEIKRTKGQVNNYLGIDFKIKYARQDLKRFETAQLLKVFDQNHLNLFFIEFVLILLIFLLGLFREYLILQIPAAMSATLLFSILTMMVGAVTFWLKSWTLPVLLFLLYLINVFSQTPLLNRPHTAFGMDYDAEPAVYHLDRLDALSHPDTLKKDHLHTLEILNHWRDRFPSGEKPKMLLLATSGGGQRAALWTLKVLQEAHRVTGGSLFEHTRLITGASGGIIGAAFFRELYLRSLSDTSLNLTDKVYLEQISADNLNPIIFTLLVNDLLIRSQYFYYNERYYLKDRGYAFEHQLNMNTQGILDKPLMDYWLPEWRAEIPMLPVAPLVINDARKLIISPHSMSYMSIIDHRVSRKNEKSQVIDFLRFFREQDAENLRFISALRMGATFPFITPNIQLPSVPQMSTMDAGLADNFGIQDALKFAFIFKDWIKENTSGVVLMTIRDSEKVNDIQDKPIPSLIQKIIIPIQNIYINWDNVQTLDNDGLYHIMEEALPFELDRVEFEYSTENYVMDILPAQDKDDPKTQEELEVQKASLNWRLTAGEKKSIINSIYTVKNQNSLLKLNSLFSAPRSTP